MIKCNKCSSEKIRKEGIRRGKQRFFCNDCRNNFSIPLVELDEKDTDIPEVKDNKENKLLCFDLEVSPLRVWVWQLWGEQHISPDAIDQDQFIISWSAKWLFDNETQSAVVTPEEAMAGDDSRIVLQLWKLLDEAQILIGHNSQKYDHRKLNARFAKHNLPLPRPYKVIDTCLIAKNVFGFTSNSLDYLCKHLDLNSGKTDHEGLGLWLKCVAGDESALLEMQNYNINDSTILESLYLKLRPYIKNHPNVNLYGEMEDQRCPACGSPTLVSKGFYYTNTGKYESFRCEACTALSRGKVNQLSKEERKSLLTG